MQNWGHCSPELCGFSSLCLSALVYPSYVDWPIVLTQQAETSHPRSSFLYCLVQAFNKIERLGVLFPNSSGQNVLLGTLVMGSSLEQSGKQGEEASVCLTFLLIIHLLVLRCYSLRSSLSPDGPPCSWFSLSWSCTILFHFFFLLFLLLPPLSSRFLLFLPSFSFLVIFPPTRMLVSWHKGTLIIFNDIIPGPKKVLGL